MIVIGLLWHVGIAKNSRVKRTFIFHRVRVLKKDFSFQKIEFLFFFSKNNHFGQKLSTEPESLFERISSLYVLFFNCPTLKKVVAGIFFQIELRIFYLRGLSTEKRSLYDSEDTPSRRTFKTYYI